MVSPSKQKQAEEETVVGRKNFKDGRKHFRPLYLPLKSKRFYLYIKNYSKEQELAQDIRQLGGVVEDFLSKNLDYIVISSETSITASASSEAGVPPGHPSPPELPVSPLTPFTPSLVSSQDSPLNLESQKEEGRKRPKTRAEVLLERACLKRVGASDVLENARSWGTTVWTVSKLRKWLSVLKKSSLYQVPKDSTQRRAAPPDGDPLCRPHSSASAGGSSKSGKPFLKVENFNRSHRPQLRELSSWPRLNISCSLGVSPFDSADRLTKPCHSKELSMHRDGRRERCSKRKPRKEKTSYCELCRVHYSNLQSHTESESHVSFARDPHNYAQLDELIFSPSSSEDLMLAPQ